MTFLCFSGAAQSGKDTSAGFAIERLQSAGKSSVIIHYADLLKFMCKQYFGWNGKKDSDGRTLLQYVGTDVVRKQDPDYWVDFVIKFIELFKDKWEYVLIPDCRFPNEINKLKSLGKVVHIKIYRPSLDSGLSATQRAHFSEHALDNTDPDHLIQNDTLDRLQRDIVSIIDTYMEEDTNEKQ